MFRYMNWALREENFSAKLSVKTENENGMVWDACADVGKASIYTW